MVGIRDMEVERCWDRVGFTRAEEGRAWRLPPSLLMSINFFRDRFAHRQAHINPSY